MDTNPLDMSQFSSTLPEAKELAMDAMDAGLVPYLTSSPGVGKSKTLQSIAEEYNLLFIDIRLAYYDPVAINGFPVVSGNKSKFIPMEQFPVEGDELPKKYDKKGKEIGTYDGWLIVFEELSSCAKAVQSAAYGIILDGLVGQNKLHESVICAATGNLVTDNAHVLPMSTALKSRLFHIPVRSDLDSWLDYAIKSNVDSRIIAYIRNDPGMLNDFNPKDTDLTYPCERTWTDFLSPMIEDIEDITQAHTMRIAGAIGIKHAIKFIAECEYFREAPKIDEILKNPTTVPIPSSPSIAYMLSVRLLQEFGQDDDVDTAISYFMQRIPPEFISCFCKDVLRRNPRLRAKATYRALQTKAGLQLM